MKPLPPEAPSHTQISLPQPAFFSQPRRGLTRGSSTPTPGLPSSPPPPTGGRPQQQQQQQQSQWRSGHSPGPGGGGAARRTWNAAGKRELCGRPGRRHRQQRGWGAWQCQGSPQDGLLAASSPSSPRGPPPHGPQPEGCPHLFSGSPGGTGRGRLPLLVGGGAARQPPPLPAPSLLLALVLHLRVVGHHLLQALHRLLPVLPQATRQLTVHQGRV